MYLCKDKKIMPQYSTIKISSYSETGINYNDMCFVFATYTFAPDTKPRTLSDPPEQP